MSRTLRRVTRSPLACAPCAVICGSFNAKALFNGGESAIWREVSFAHKSADCPSAVGIADQSY